MDLHDYLLVSKLTAQQFGDRLGVSKIQVWRWVNGRHFPEAATLATIIAASDGKITADAMLRNFMRHSPDGASPETAGRKAVGD